MMYWQHFATREEYQGAHRAFIPIMTMPSFNKIVIPSNDQARYPIYSHGYYERRGGVSKPLWPSKTYRGLRTRQVAARFYDR